MGRSGAARGTRTPDPLITNLVYYLRYPTKAFGKVLYINDLTPIIYDSAPSNCRSVAYLMLTSSDRLSTTGSSAMPKLTKTFIDNIMPDHDKDVVLWDADLSSFGIRLKPSGVRSFIIQYRNADGVSKRKTIGRYGVLTPDEARKEARQLLAEVARGGDPATAAKAKRSAPTVADLADRYMREHAAVHKKPRSQEEDARMIDKTIKPALGAKKAASVTRDEIAGLHHSMKETPYAANRTLALLSKMFNLAEAWDLRLDGSNPCRLVKKFKEQKRERLLSADELGRLGDELAKTEAAGQTYPGIILAIRLLALTGCRRNEVLSFRWEDIDLSAGTVRLRDAKTGPRTVMLGAPAVALLTAVEPIGPFVVHGPEPEAPLSQWTLAQAWKRIRPRAGLSDVRINDLRHQYGSTAGGAGHNQFIVRDLMGHKDLQTTGRYVHGDENPLKIAADATAGQIAAAMGNGHGAVVVPLKRMPNR